MNDVLKKGHQYTPLIATSNCKRSKLGTGDTFYTVDKMQEWVHKYHKQVSKLAPKLKGSSLEQSVRNIHRFLVDHIAYKADGALQVIKSPACTWVTRTEGTDCKTFSIFASCLLTQMGYNHFIRQVKQPYLHPDMYTHVYVVVPLNQSSTTPGKYLVLDGTVPNNQEVAFSDVKDEFMSGLAHVGLAGANVGRNGAQIAHRLHTGLGNPAPALAGLDGFLQFLTGSGVALNITNAIRAKVVELLNAGIDPRFEITPQGVQVENVLFPYQATGRSASTLRDPLLYVNAQLGIATTGRSQTSTQSGNEVETIAQVANAVLDSGFLDSTFGAVFANGFDLSCWGSSMSPSKAKTKVNKVLGWLLSTSGLTGATSVVALNKFLKTSAILKSHFKIYTQSKYAKCTREGGQLGLQLLTAYENKVIAATNNTLQSNGVQLDGNRTINLPATSLRVPAWSQTLNRKSGEVQALSYSSSSVDSDIVIPVGVNVPTGNTPVTSIPTIPGTPYTGGTGNTGDSRPPKETVSTANTSTIIGVIALAAGAYYMYEQKKGKK